MWCDYQKSAELLTTGSLLTRNNKRDLRVVQERYKDTLGSGNRFLLLQCRCRLLKLEDSIPLTVSSPFSMSYLVYRLHMPVQRNLGQLRALQSHSEVRMAACIPHAGTDLASLASCALDCSENRLCHHVKVVKTLRTLCKEYYHKGLEILGTACAWAVLQAGVLIKLIGLVYSDPLIPCSESDGTIPELGVLVVLHVQSRAAVPSVLFWGI